MDFISLRKALLSLGLFVLVFTSRAQTQPDKKLTKLIDNLVSPQFATNEPGVSILVAKKGRIVYEKAFGSANIELNVAMRPDMVFRIGSVTKQFTAIAILQLAEQGKISLQDSVQKYVKDFPAKGDVITIENLLTHTSGIVDYTSLDDPDPFIERRDFTPQFLISYIKNKPLQFKPGSKYSYSNSNYLLLGYIIQLVSGENYHQFMQDNIIKPAGLSHTFYAEEKTIIPNRAEGYTRDNGFFENCDYQTLSLGFACGDLLSTTEDLYQWNNTLIANKLISKQSINKAFMPFELTDATLSTYGYGWFIDTTSYGRLCIHHEGQTSGFIALEKYFPGDSTYIAILTNVKSGEDKTNFSYNRFRLFDQITLLALGEQISQEAKVSDKILSNYTGTFQLDSIPGKPASTDKIKLFIRIEDKKLYANLSNGSGKNMYLSPQSETLFVLPDVKRIHTTIEFIIKNGEVTGLFWKQEDKLEFRKIK